MVIYVFNQIFKPPEHFLYRAPESYPGEEQGRRLPKKKERNTCTRSHVERKLGPGMQSVPETGHRTGRQKATNKLVMARSPESCVWPVINWCCGFAKKQNWIRFRGHKLEKLLGKWEWWIWPVGKSAWFFAGQSAFRCFSGVGFVEEVTYLGFFVVSTGLDFAISF